jgi:hypothetical protein
MLAAADEDQKRNTAIGWHRINGAANMPKPADAPTADHTTSSKL